MAQLTGTDTMALCSPFGKSIFLQRAVEGILDQIPADTQQPGHIQHRHGFGQRQDKTLKRLGVPPPWLGNTQLDSADKPT